MSSSAIFMSCVDEAAKERISAEIMNKLQEWISVLQSSSRSDQMEICTSSSHILN